MGHASLEKLVGDGRSVRQTFRLLGTSSGARTRMILPSRETPMKIGSWLRGIQGAPTMTTGFGVSVRRFHTEQLQRVARHFNGVCASNFVDKSLSCLRKVHFPSAQHPNHSSHTPTVRITSTVKLR